MADLKQICIDGQCMNIGGGDEYPSIIKRTAPNISLQVAQWGNGYTIATYEINYKAVTFNAWVSTGVTSAPSGGIKIELPENVQVPFKAYSLLGDLATLGSNVPDPVLLTYGLWSKSKLTLYPTAITSKTVSATTGNFSGTILVIGTADLI